MSDNAEPNNDVIQVVEPVEKPKKSMWSKRIAGYFGNQMDPDFVLAFGENYMNEIPERLLSKIVDAYMNDRSLEDNPEGLRELKNKLE